MSRRHRSLGIAVLAALALSLAAAGPSHAGDAMLTCFVSGELKMRDKDLPFLGMRLAGGKGDFFFDDAQLVCLGEAKGEPDIEFTARTTWSGYYHNEVCGTARFFGEINDVYHTSDPKFDLMLLGRKFLIDFKANQGAFHWADGPITFEDPKTNEVHGWETAGLFTMIASASKFEPPHMENCWKGAQWIGFFYVEENV